MDRSTMREFNKMSKRQQSGVIIFLIEYSTFVFALVFGAKLLCDPVGSSSPGFKFLGLSITLIGAGIVVLITGSCVIGVRGEGSIVRFVCCTLPLIIALAALGVFALAVSSESGGKSVPGRSYREYELESYSQWMQNKVNYGDNWRTHYVKAFLKDNTCDSLLGLNSSLTLAQFRQLPLNHFQSGCCKPPEACNFNYTNPTTWTKPVNANFSNNDCNEWSNNPYILCFDCQSCKAAFLEDVTSQWKLTGLLIVLLCGKHYVVGICFVIGLAYNL